MARKTKLNDDLVKIFTTAIEVGMTNVLACKYAGITESTFYSWLDRGRKEKEGVYVEFLQSIKKAESKHALINLAIVQKAAKTGSWHAACWLLERRHPSFQKQPDQVVEIQLDNSELSTSELLEQIKQTNEKINELIKQPIIDMDD